VVGLADTRARKEVSVPSLFRGIPSDRLTALPGLTVVVAIPELPPLELSNWIETSTDASRAWTRTVSVAGLLA
jgi:hypothetical protein